MILIVDKIMPQNLVY